MIVRLPWPHKDLSPNARVHHQARARVAAVAKEAAWVDTLNQLSVRERKALSERETLHLAITFRPPDERKRDLDNMLAAAKSTLDGFAHACLIDDYKFSLSLRRAGKVKGGQIEVFIPVNQPVDNSAFACRFCGNVPQNERAAMTLPTSRGPNHHAKGPRHGS